MFDLEGMENREFDPGSADCLGIFRDFYKQNFNIDIRNYARTADWRADKLDLIGACAAREGFDQISNWKLKDLRPGDVLCMAIAERNPNHMAIYIGDNKILHHLRGCLSTIAPLEGRWINCTCFILRHPEVPDLRPQYTPVPIEELLRARHKVQPSAQAEA